MASTAKTYRITLTATGETATEALGERLTKRQANAFMNRMERWGAAHMYKITPND